MNLRHKRAAAEIKKLSLLGLSYEEFFQQIRRPLDVLLPGSAHESTSILSDGRFGKVLESHPTSERLLQHFFTNLVYVSIPGVFPGFNEVRSLPAGVAYPSQSTAFLNSRHYHEFYKLRNARHFIYMSMNQPGANFGFSFIRDEGGGPYSQADQNLLRQLLPLLQFGFSHEISATGQSREIKRGVIIVSSEGQILFTSQEGLELLTLAGHKTYVVGSNQYKNFDTDFVTFVVKSIVKKARETFDDGSAPEEQHKNAYGTFRFRLTHLNSSKTGFGLPKKLFSIEIAHLVRSEIYYFQRLAHLALSPMQNIICVKVMQGKSYPQIALELEVTAATVITQTKRILAKIGRPANSKLIDWLRSIC